MATNYSSANGVARVTVNKNAAPAPRPAATSQRSQGSRTAAPPPARRPVTIGELHALATKQATDAKALAVNAARTKGYALGKEACAAAAAMGWGQPTGAEEVRSGLIIHFARGNRAVISVNTMTIALHPAAKG